MIREILDQLTTMYPEAEWAGPQCTADPLQALVATILSAQCRDDYVDRVTPALFTKYPTVQSFANADLEELRGMVCSINHYKKKAERIKKACELIIKHHNGQVPLDQKKLTALPGVGMKTANAVLRRCGIDDAGFVVDTHVKRVAYRLGLTSSEDANKARKELEVLVPKEEWGTAGWRMILHGRNKCHARGPQCHSCQLRQDCPQVSI